MRILLVDDHPITRAALSSLLEPARLHRRRVRPPTARRRSSSRGGCRPTSSCSTSRCRAWTGLTALPRSREAAPGCEVVVLTASGTEENLLAAIRGGAAGYLLKSEPPERIAEFLRGVGRRRGGALGRGRPAAARAGARGGAEPRRPRRRSRRSLSARELEVLLLLDEHLGTDEIAAAALHLRAHRPLAREEPAAQARTSPRAARRSRRCNGSRRVAPA